FKPNNKKRSEKRTMTDYEKMARLELKAWERKIYKKPSLANRYAKSLQTKINEKIPDRFHRVITSAVKQTVQAVLIGSEYTTKQQPLFHASLEEREQLV